MVADGRRITRNIVAISTGELLSKLLGFAGIAYIGRVAGGDVLGMIGFSTAVLGYFSLAGNPGLETIGVREIAAGRQTHSRTVSLVTGMRLLLLVPVAALFLLFALTTSIDATTRTVLLLFGASLLLQPFSLDFYFSGRERMGAVALRRVLQAAIYLGGILLLVSSTEDALLIPVIFAAAMMMSYLAQIFQTREPGLLRRAEITRDRLRTLLRSAFVVGGAQLLIMTYLQIDLVMCGLMLSTGEVGLYTADQRLAAAIAVLPWVILQASLPMLSRVENDVDRRNGLLRLLRLMLPAGAVISVAGYLLAEPILLTVFGNSYLAGSDALRILFLNTGLVFVNMALANPLLAWKRDREYLLIVLGGAALNIALNAVLIPTMGIEGAAWATVAAEVLVLLLALRAQRSILLHRSG
ncbi:MAG: hypothetical protein C0600_06345 [Ignavibacteria bacterium]|nr:MAG: hypothetical protein C0600_06345 [Ignavibacteria bacterium]